MIVELPTAYVDTSAAALRWGLDVPLLPALASRDVRLGDAELGLRVLGASHQVLARLDGATVSEVVACDVSAPDELPAAAHRVVSGADYSFTSHVTVLGEDALRAQVRQLLSHLRDEACAVVGRFPGSPYAVTALVAATCPGGVTWRTWHAYPGTGELVATRTTVTR